MKHYILERTWKKYYWTNDFIERTLEKNKSFSSMTEWFDKTIVYLKTNEIDGKWTYNSETKEINLLFTTEKKQTKWVVNEQCINELKLSWRRQNHFSFLFKHSKGFFKIRLIVSEMTLVFENCSQL